MNPYFIETVLREKKCELLREAERLKLIAQYNAANPPITVKLLAALGDTLIRLGERLRNRYGMPAHSLAGQNPCKDC